MARKRKEWLGETHDTPIPPRVKDRIAARQDWHCRDCGRPFSATLPPEYHHEPALINGGENRESKIVALCEFCHLPHTIAGMAEKSKLADIRKRHHGLTKPKRQWPKRKFGQRFDGNVREIHEDLSE